MSLWLEGCSGFMYSHIKVDSRSLEPEVLFFIGEGSEVEQMVAQQAHILCVPGSSPGLANDEWTEGHVKQATERRILK